MRKFIRIFAIGLWLLLPGWVSAQLPTLSITPGGNMSVCSGSNINLSATVNNAFYSTTSYTTSDIAFSPYSIPGGTSLNMNDDTIIGPLPIGFQFCFFGNTYTQFYLGSNGWIGFSPGQPRSFVAMSVPYSLPSPPNPGVPRNCIMGPWMDFNPQVPGGPYIKYQTQGIAPYRRLVVQWTNCPLYLCTALKATLQIVIFESTNIIENYITNKPICNSWAGGTSTQALHNQSGTVAVAIPGRNASVWTANNDGKRYTPSGPPSYNISWTANGFPIGTGTTASYTVSANTRLIGKATFQCSNLIIYDTLDVSIGGAASASFSVNGSAAATPPPVCVGQPVNFTYTGGATGTGAWTFTGANPATGTGLVNQTVTYSTPGTYTVGLTVTPSGGTCSPGSSSKTITVIAAPPATMSLPATACINTNASVSIAGAPVSGATYSWNFGSGASPATATGAGPHTVQWASSGTKTINLTVSQGSCTATGSGIISITAAPVASFTTSPSTVCTGNNSTITFNGTAPSGTSYSWNFGSGASMATAANSGPFNINWSSAGVKTVSLTVSSGSCSSTLSQNLTVSNPPSANFNLPASVCVGNNVAITYTGGAAAPPTANYAWNLNGGSPVAGNTSGPLNVSWSVAGTKTVSLTVTENGCSSVPVSKNIVVNALPVVSIAASPVSQCIGQPVSVAVSGTMPSGAATYQWSFPGGSPASSTSSGPVNVSWSAAGTQTASLTVTENGCSSLPASTNITVTSPVTAVISLPASACVGAPVTISASGSFPTGTLFNWNFNGGTVLSGSGQGPYSVSWGSNGSKTVNLTTTAGSCSSTASSSISIQGAPIASIGVPAVICENQSAVISFNGTAAAGATFAWNFGSGASPASVNSAGPHSVTWSGSGSKTISLTVNAGGCTASTTQNLSLNPAFSPVLSIPSGICSGSNANISQTAVLPAGSTYSWNFGLDASPLTANSTGPYNVFWSSAGAKTVSLSVTSGGCTYSSSASATVFNMPAASFSVPTSVCNGSTLPVSISPVAGTTYSWSFGAGANPATASGAGPHNVSWSSSGSKNISVTALANGCNAGQAHTVNVNAVPLANFSMPATACAGTPVNIQYTGSASSGATFNWNFGAGASPASATGIGPHQVIFSAGNRNVSLTVSENGCTSAPVSNSIVVNASPTAQFSVPASICSGRDVAVSYTGNGGTGAVLSWNFGTGTVNGAVGRNNQVSFPAGNTSVGLTVTENGCSSPVNNVPLSIKLTPTAIFTTPASVCEGEAAQLIYQGNGGNTASYTWYYPGATHISGSGSDTVNIQWVQAGNTSVGLQVDLNGCSSDPYNLNVLVKNKPTANFNVIAGKCIGDTVLATFNGSASSSVTYSWSYPGATLISGAGTGIIRLIYSGAGTHTIGLVVNDGGCQSVPFSSNFTQYQSYSASFSLNDTIYVSQTANAVYSGSSPSTASYIWTYPNGTLINGSGPGPLMLSWSQTGQQQVRLKIDNQGCVSPEQSKSVMVLPIPSSKFFVSNDSICTGTIILANYGGTVLGVAQYNWNFDGATVLSGNGAGPYQLEWGTAGVKQIKLDVSINGVHSASWQETVRVIEVPRAPFSLPNSVCAGSDVSPVYTGTQSASNQFNWSYDGGNATGSQGSSPIFSWSTPGIKTVTLSVADAMCISILESRTITVYQIPDAQFSAPSFLCQPGEAEIVYTGNAGSTASYTWKLDGAAGTPIATDTFNVHWLASGVKHLELEVEENGCKSAVYSVSIDVRSRPVVNAGSDLLLCSGDTVRLQAGGSSTMQYKWFPAWGLSADSIANPELSLTTVHSYVDSIQYRLEGNDGFCIAYDTIVVALAPMPEASYDVPAAQCFDGHAFNFNAGGSYTSSATFYWDFGSEGYSHTPYEENQRNIRFDSPGEHPVALTISQFGCVSEKFSDTITVFTQPEGNFSLNPVKDCIPLNTTFSVDNPVSGYTYQWQYGDGTYGSGQQSDHTYRQSGYMTVSLIVNDINGCKTLVTKPQAVEVLERPIAGFRISPEVVILGSEIELNNLSHNTKFSYYIIGNDTILGATSAYTLNEPGTHVITQVVVNAQGCQDEVSHQVRVVHGTTVFIPTAFTPNNDGNNDLFRIEGTELYQYYLIVFDRWGSEVFSSRDIHEGWDGYSRSGEPLPEGVYGYVLEARNKDNQDIRERGQVTLIR